jgi:hypothetical protein
MSNDLYGVWVISQESLRHLQNEGWKKYIDQTDHMIKFNTNGTCIYRTADWFIHVNFRDEIEAYTGNSFRSRCSEFHKNDYRSYYIFKPNKTLKADMIQGPYTNKPTVSNKSFVVCTNQNYGWQIVDWAKSSHKRKPIERYTVQFYNDPESKLMPYTAKHFTICCESNSVALYSRLAKFDRVYFVKLSNGESAESASPFEDRFRRHQEACRTGIFQGP